MAESKLSRWIRTKMAQVPYNIFQSWKLPDWLDKATNLLMRYVHFPKFAEIVKVCYNLVKSIEDKGMSGSAKKGSVVKDLETFLKLINVKLPSTVRNVLIELCAFFVKYEAKF